MRCRLCSYTLCISTLWLKFQYYTFCVFQVQKRNLRKRTSSNRILDRTHHQRLHCLQNRITIIEKFVLGILVLKKPVLEKLKNQSNVWVQHHKITMEHIQVEIKRKWIIITIIKCRPVQYLEVICEFIDSFWFVHIYSVFFYQYFRTKVFQITFCKLWYFWTTVWVTL